MNNIKHNKLKNTVILFEILTDKLVSEAMTNTKETPKVLRLIKKHFNAKSVLFKELGLYRSLLTNPSTDTISEKTVDKYVDLVIESRTKMSDSLIKTSKYALIKDIKSMYGDNFLENAMKKRFKNYPQMASAYKLFEYNGTDNVADIMYSRKCITENLISVKETETDTPWTGLSKSVRNIGLKNLLEKFNAKYGKLLPEQKDILKCMINTPEKLKGVLTEHAKNIHSKLNSMQIADDVVRIKIENLVGLLKEMKFDSYIIDNQLSALMNCYTLINELNND